jgi:spore germination protein KC
MGGVGRLWVYTAVVSYSDQTESKEAEGLKRLFIWGILLLLQIPLLTGCWSRVELEELAFVPSIGLDKGDNQLIQLTARVIIPSALGSPGGGGGGGAEAKTSKLVSVQAHTIGEALSFLNQVVERQPSFSHCSAVIFGEQLAKEGLIKYMRPLAQYREFRRTMFVFTAKGKAADIMKLDKPVIEKSPNRFIENLIKTSDRTGMLPRVQLHDFLTTSEVPHVDPITILVGINPKVKKEAKQEEMEAKKTDGDEPAVPVFGLDQQASPKITGQMKRAGGNPMEYVGTAVYRNDKLVGQLDGQETQLLQMIRGSFKRGILSFSDPLQKGAYVSIIMNVARPPKLDVRMQPDPMHPTIRMGLMLEGDLFGVQANSDFTMEKNRIRLESQISKEIEVALRKMVDKLRHDWHADALAIGKQTRMKFLKEEEFKAYDWRTAFDQATVEYTVNFHLRRIGMQGVPPNVPSK